MTIKETGDALDSPGFLNGRHYTTYVATVRDLERRGSLDLAEQLLLQLVEATESEARALACGVAPWYYEQLAVIYRRQHAVQQELEILSRYSRQPKAPGAKRGRLAERLARLLTQADIKS